MIVLVIGHWKHYLNWSAGVRKTEHVRFYWLGEKHDIGEWIEYTGAATV